MLVKEWREITRRWPLTCRWNKCRCLGWNLRDKRSGRARGDLYLQWSEAVTYRLLSLKMPAFHLTQCCYWQEAAGCSDTQNTRVPTSWPLGNRLSQSSCWVILQDSWKKSCCECGRSDRNIFKVMIEDVW